MTSPRYVVDSDILILIQRAHLEPRFAQLGRLPLVVTALVWDEVVGPNADATRVAGLRSMLAATVGQPTDFEAESHEALVFAQLQQPPPTEGVGEHSVIAHVLTHSDAIAVLNDKKAIQRATEEVPGRVLGLHGFLRQMVEGGHIPLDLAQALSGEYCRRYTPARPPLWWPPRAPES